MSLGSNVVCVIIELQDSDRDMSWLTQTPKLENGEHNCDLGVEYIEEEIFNNDQENIFS